MGVAATKTDRVGSLVCCRTGDVHMLVQPAQRIYRTWIIDSRRWEHYRPRSNDIVIATYPKCGTTWMQRIVSLLVFQTTAPQPIMELSPWIDRRFPEPVEAVLARIEAQDHRRFLKAHLPFDGLPIYDGVKYILVARDGCDACMSYHHHCSALTPQLLDTFDRIGREDDTIGRPYPRPQTNPAEFFHRWLTEGVVPGDHDGSPMMSFFHFVRTWWDERNRANVLLVHYNDLKGDLEGEMRRIAEYLDISVAPGLWPDLVAEAGFEAMHRDGDILMGKVASMFQGGGRTFFHKGTNERWRGVFREDDLGLYDAKVEAMFSAACARWVAQGRLSAPDPRSTPD
jgi:aryl sulfotransferase